MTDAREVLARRTEREDATKPEDESFERGRRHTRRLERRRNYVVTSAQNNTEPEWAFLKALEVYAAERDAELVVIPIRYKNPTSRKDPQEESTPDYWWHPALHPYLVENTLRVHPLLSIMGDWKIQATSPRPLGTMEAPSKDASAVYGHGQLAMRTVATPHHHLPKILHTTGSVTEKNYSTTKAGKLAAFHHTHAAVVVETRGKRFHLRDVTWDGRGFADLDRYYTPEGATDAPPVAALVTGDEHAWFNDPAVRRATYGKGGIVEVLRPEIIVRHDVLDCYSVSPHHNRNSITRAVKAQFGRGSLRAELEDTIRFLDKTTPEGVLNVVVSSNHHDHLTAWLRNGEAHVAPENAVLYHRLKAAVLEEARFTPKGVEHPDPFALYARDRLQCRVRFLGDDESFQVEGIELGMHGHLGPNGARGNAAGLSKIGTRSIIGHSHSPCIEKGVYQVGTSSRLRLEYNAGPSSWLHAHAVVHDNGKRQMVYVIDGRWRG